MSATPLTPPAEDAQYMSDSAFTFKPTVAMLCPWLERKGTVGIFFREQAELARHFCDPILVRLRPLSRRSAVNRLGRAAFECETTSEGIEMWTVVHPRLHSSLYRYQWSRRAMWHVIRRVARGWHRRIVHTGRHVHLIHSQSILRADWAQQFSRAIGVPYVLTEHQQISLSGWHRGQVQAMESAVREASAVTACSRDKIRQFAANGVFFPITSIGNVINSAHFHPRSDFVSREEVRLVTTGALSAIKDHPTLLRAISLVARRAPDRAIHFTWLGCNGWGSDQADAAKKLLAKFGLGNINTTLIPLATRSEVGRVLRESDIFVFSSISEGMPVSILEALACGLPVVTTNCGGVDEVINASNGMIVPVSDPDRLADAIVEMIEHRHMIDSLAISGAALDRYGTSAFSKVLQRLYLDTINEKSTLRDRRGSMMGA